MTKKLTLELLKELKKAIKKKIIPTVKINGKEYYAYHSLKNGRLKPIKSKRILMEIQKGKRPTFIIIEDSRGWK